MGYLADGMTEKALDALAAMMGISVDECLLLEDDTDRRYMLEALVLAQNGAGWVNPNPMVGCVIVAGGTIIGRGYHERYGAAHAERAALQDCKQAGCDPTGSTAYVTLEPCAHFGKTPPCADALIEAKVARVVIGSSDPNPLVAGQGVARMRDAGIEVVTGVLKEYCDAINRPFFHFITTKLPFVVAKFASTLDGKIATFTGESKWITSPAARRRVHEDRARYAAIMVGVATVIADDPRLSARIERGDVSGIGIHQPLRVVVDTHLRCPLDAQVVTSAKMQPTLMATCVKDPVRIQPYEAAGCRVVCVAQDTTGRVDLHALLHVLGEQGIDSIYVEGGSTLLGSLFDQGIPDKVDAYFAPKIFGGANAPSPIAGHGVSSPSGAPFLERVSVRRLGDDVLISGEVCREGERTRNR